MSAAREIIAESLGSGPMLEDEFFVSLDPDGSGNKGLNAARADAILAALTDAGFTVARLTKLPLEARSVYSDQPIGGFDFFVAPSTTTNEGTEQ